MGNISYNRCIKFYRDLMRIDGALRPTHTERDLSTWRDFSFVETK